MNKKALKNRNEKSKNGMTKPIFREDKHCFELRFTYTDVNGEKKRKSFSSQSTHECNRKREEFLLELEKIKNGVVIDSTIPEILTIDNEKKLRLNKQKEQGFGRNMDTISYIERSSIGRIPIREITIDQLEYFLCEITRFANDTIEKIYRMVKKAFYIANIQKVIDENPFENPRYNLERPKSSKPTKIVPPLTIEEQEIFVAALEEYRNEKTSCNKYHHQFLIELFSGMRMGEINALTPADIDFNKSVIYVTKTVTRDRDKKTFISFHPKTDRGMREVPMLPIVANVLREAIAEMKPNKRMLIFCDKKTGQLISTQQVNSAYHRICESAGLKDKYSEHDLEYFQLGQHQLRHTFGTRCVEAGMDYKVISDIMGHSDIHVTIDTYASTLNQHRNDNMNKLSEYLGNI